MTGCRTEYRARRHPVLSAPFPTCSQDSANDKADVEPSVFVFWWWERTPVQTRMAGRYGWLRER